MNIFNLIKKTPFLLALFIIILISIFNQKENTRLKILIWNTPTLSIGSYLAISSGTGFILSYIFTTNLAKNKKSIFRKELKYKIRDDKDENEIIQDTDLYNERNNDIPYDNNFIERDVKDPSPTINANFRIISKNSRRNESQQKSQYNTNNLSDESDIQDYEKEFNYKDNYDDNPKSNDWDDDNYENW